MANDVKLTFVGDSKSLERSAKSAGDAVQRTGASATTASQNFNRAAGETKDFGTRMGQLGAATSGMTDAIDSATAVMDGLVQIQDSARQKAQRLAQAQNDVRQAQEDMAQATRDASQAQIDQRQAQQDEAQALLDGQQAQDDYNAAVAEFGKNSIQAKQALLDAGQAEIDITQAREDSTQAARDANQATIDAKQGQIDLNDAMHESKSASDPSTLQKWSQTLGLISPLLSGMVGVVALVTAAQWAWNAAQLASPTTWIILAIVALVAIIVVIATKTTWFQTIWKKAWEGIQLYIKVFKAVWSGVWQGIVAAFNFLKNAVASYASYWVSMWSRVINFVRGVPGRIKGFFSGIGSWFRNIGSNIVSGIINGIRNSLGRLASTAANAARSALKAAKNALGISSPSRVFRNEVGQMIGEGMTKGIQDSASGVATATADLASFARKALASNSLASAAQAHLTWIGSGASSSTRPGMSRELFGAYQRQTGAKYDNGYDVPYMNWLRGQAGGGGGSVQVVVQGTSDADRAMSAWLQKLARDGKLKGLAV